MEASAYFTAPVFLSGRMPITACRSLARAVGAREVGHEEALSARSIGLPELVLVRLEIEPAETDVLGRGDRVPLHPASQHEEQVGFLAEHGPLDGEVFALEVQDGSVALLPKAARWQILE